MQKWFEMKSTGEKSAEILLYGPIGGGNIFEPGGLTAEQFAKDLKALGDVDNITLRINSPGGDVFDGLAIHNLLKEHKAKVDVKVDGIAASAASFIAMAGDTITIPDNAFFLIHEPSGGVMGTSEQMLSMAADLDRMSGVFADTYAARSGGKIDKEKVTALMKEDRLMTAIEARDLGFADVVAEPVLMAAAYDLNSLPPKAREAFKAAIVAQADKKTGDDDGDEVEVDKDGKPILDKDGKPIPKKKAPVASSDLDTVRAEARAEYIAYAQEVRDLCTLAGAQAKFADFIVAQTPIEQVRAALVDARADADEQIVGHHRSAATRPAAASWEKTIGAINERTESVMRRA